MNGKTVFQYFLVKVHWYKLRIGNAILFYMFQDILDGSVGSRVEQPFFCFRILNAGVDSKDLLQSPLESFLLWYMTTNVLKNRGPSILLE